MGRWLYYTKKLARRWSSRTMDKGDAITIALDAMGGDFGPMTTLEGALAAVSEQPNLRVLLVGREPELRKALGKAFLPPEVEIVHADDAFGMAEPPTEALKRPNCSIVRGLELLSSGVAQGFVSSGNTGAIVAASLVKLGRIPGIERPALMTLLPTLHGHPSLVLDIGANVDCKPEHLVRFAQMGSLYASEVLERENPTVALLSIGEEPSKGNSAVKLAHERLSKSGLNFVGNIEGSDVLYSKADVVVTDGFVGNILIKFGEGSIGFFKSVAKKGRRNNLFSMAGGLLMHGGFRKVMREFDYAEYGGAPLLGVKGNVIIGHGKSSSVAISNAISLAFVMAMARIETIIQEFVQNEGGNVENSDTRHGVESTR